MWPVIVSLSVVLLLLLLFLGMCQVIGSRFLQNLKRRNPDEPFRAAIDISFYQNSPHKAAAEKGMELMKTLPHREVWITSVDGLRLHATLFPAPGGEKKYVLGIHGFQSRAWHEYAPFLAFYRSLGYSMLLPDDRAHGLSEGPYITMGVKDRFDCISWARYLVQQFGQDVQILLHGVSMGGATVLAASAEDTLPEQVFGVVSDCGYTSVADQMDFQMKSMFHMKGNFPARVCMWYARHRAGFDPEQAEPLEQVKKARVPILFIQGAKDFLVPEEMAHRLYDACASRKQLVVIEEASHAESIAVDPERYHQAIRSFFAI